MPLKNSNVQPATLRLSQILENITQQGGTSVVVSGAQSALTREVAIAKVITTSNITLSGSQTIDGISVVQGDTVLVNNQTSEVNNGLFGVRNTAWVRLTDPPMISGLPVIVNQGTTADSLWVQMRDFTNYVDGTTNLKWVQVGTGTTYTVSDTDTIDMVMTGTVISANLRYEDGFTVDFTESSAGLKAEVIVQDTNTVDLTTASSGGLYADVKYQDTNSIDLSDNSSGLKADLRLDTAGANGIIPSITTDGLRLIHNFNAGLGVEFLANTPSGGAVQVKHNLTEGDAIELLANDPSTGNLKVQVEDAGITTDKIANNAVTFSKLDVGIDVSSTQYLEIYSTIPSGDTALWKFKDFDVQNIYRQYTFNTGGTSGGTVKTFRIPSNVLEFLPRGMYHIDVYGQISAVQVGMPTRKVRHEQAPILSIAVSGGGARTIDRGATHADPITGVHNFYNTALSGGCLIDLTSSTMTDRYFEITFDMTITDSTGAANTASVSNGTCDVFRLTVPSTVIVHET